MISLHTSAKFLLVAALIVGQPGLARAASQELEARMERYRDALATELPAPARLAVARIDGAARQWLALRSYLRARDRLHERWSWSEDEIETFERTQAYETLLAEVQRVQTRFERENPGYTLYANTDVRSLDTQIERWNANPSVKRVSQSIQRAVRKEMLESRYPDQPNEAALERLAEYLQRWRPQRAAALAAPGLSAHGRLQAIDFAVYKDGKVVAPTTLTSADEVWKREGWSAKLKQATLGTHFVGPLKSPDEPWHYEYRPRVRTAGETE